MRCGTIVALWWLALHGAHAQPDALPCNEFSEGGVEEALRADPAHERACHARAMAMIRHASAHDTRLVGAEQIYKTLRHLRPQSTHADIGMAELKMRSRELGLADDEPLSVIHDLAERATRLPPAPPEAFVTLGRTELLMGCAPCAVRSAEVARALGADTPELVVLRSRIAEAGGRVEAARAILEQAAASTSLTSWDRAWFYANLAEMLVRAGKLEDADRALGSAIAAQADNLAAYVRRAEIRLFDLGDVPGALQAAEGSRRAASSPAFKRIRAMARYLAWSRDRMAGRAGEDLQRIAQVSYLSPEDAVIACARHPALIKDLEIMLDAGLVRDIDSRDGAGNTALLAAAAGGNAAAVRLLLDRHANADAADRHQRRSLTFAVQRSDHEVLARLVRAGAGVDYRDMDGRSPLLIAAQKGDSESAVVLLRHRAEQRAGPPEDGGDLLAAAAGHGDVATLRALLDAGVAVDTENRRGQTALVVAVLWGNAGAARTLLEHGADATRALEAAQEAGDGAMFELLKTYLKRST